ncbi:peptidoglycan DD-metalloendopeptidase family protein [Candidatus Parcubacteria bacterium]|nr:peptidoglycan DD-metalloendopeptidase family protein [Candidatus Parcubacteria bacterium]
MPFSGIAQTDTELQQRIDQTKRERDALLLEQRKLQTALDELNKEGQTLTGTVKSLDAARSKLATDLKITQTGINASNLQIQKLEGDINKNKTEIENHREAIRESLKRLKTYDSYSMVYALLSYNTLDDVWHDTADLTDLQDKITEEISELEESQQDLIRNRSEKELKQLELISLSRELKGQKQVADETRTAQAKLLAETKNKEALYQQMLAENIAREKEFEKLLFQFESQIKAADVTAIPIARKGVLSWPLDSVIVTQQFGLTSSSGRLYSSGTHNGIDFRASVGTPVKSVRGGVVEAMGNTDDQRGCYSYGRWVLIRHDNGLSSLYAHLSASIITQGQVVTAGQIIGYSGGQPRAYGSGYSTGPHLHLGLFVTVGVQVSQYTSSINCKNVAIPLANPQDYLDPLAYLPGF